MKRIIGLILIMSMLISCMAVNAYGYTEYSRDEIKSLLSSMEIMSGYPNGDFGYNDKLTRAQFAKIAVASSSYKSMVPQTATTSPYSDVSFKSWAAGYISTAANAGYVKGYEDGSFRPDRNVTLEEGVTVMLRLLGYTKEDLVGTYPYPQLAMAESLDLLDNVSANMGCELSRQDTMYLVYNTLRAKPKAGNSQAYIETLGYKTNNGELDINDIIYSNMQGPVTVKSTGWYTSLGLSSDANVYRDGVSCGLSDVKMYDVVYYSQKSNTVYAYSDKLTGVYQNALPNKDNPSSVVISGQTYNLGVSAKALFTSNGYSYGDVVTVLFDRDGNIADCVSNASLSSTEYGIVVAAGTATFTNSSTYQSYYADVVMMDGTEKRYEVSRSYSYYIGKAVKVDFSSGELNISTVSDTLKNDGVFNLDSMTIGSMSIAKNIKILETDECGNVFTVTPDRLNGVKISANSVLYYTTNTYGQIDNIIIDDVTADGYDYGYITKSVENQGNSESDGSMNSSYTYDILGREYQKSFVNRVLNVSKGPAQFKISGNDLDSIYSLEKNTITDISSVNDMYITTESSTSYMLSEDVVVYNLSNNKVILSSLDEAKNSKNITAYYDKPQINGGRVRVIIIK